MSNDKENMNDLSAPTITEIETLLSNTKPRPTTRLRHLVSDAPWQKQGRDINMIRLRRMEFVVTGSAILILAVIAAVMFLERPFGSGNGEPDSASPLSATRPVISSDPTLSFPTNTPAPPIEEGEMAWTAILSEDAGQQRPLGNGIAYGEIDGNGRIFVADSYQGIQRFSKTGADLGPISILDPATGQPVFVRDVVWSQLLWLAPPDYGLVILTDPFESGEYLHAIDPDQGTILDSFEINNNIALPISAPSVTASVPTQLTTNGEGEIYTDRIYAYSDESASDETNALHYLLRMIIDGRILNPILVVEQPSTDELVSMISDLAYQQGTENVYAAVNRDGRHNIEVFDPVGTPQRWLYVHGEVVNWLENVALAGDAQGHIYQLLDEPGYIVEFNQEGEIDRIIGFKENAATADSYPAIRAWLPGSIGRPLALAVTPDGSMLFVVDQKEGQINLTAFALN